MDKWTNITFKVQKIEKRYAVFCKLLFRTKLCILNTKIGIFIQSTGKWKPYSLVKLYHCLQMYASQPCLNLGIGI